MTKLNDLDPQTFLADVLARILESMMTIPVGITQVNDSFGVFYAHMMALALPAAAPVIIGYLIFQKRVTEAVMISAGVKG